MAHSDHPARTVIVTGAAGGLGYAISRRLLSDGFRCVMADRDHSKLTDVAKRLDSDAVVPVECDVRSPDDRDRLLMASVGDGHTLYGLVNCAGVAVAEPFLDEALSSWRNTIEINLEAAYFLSQGACERMRTVGIGRIVNIASVYGIIGFNNDGYGSRAPATTPGDRGPVRQSAYAASKGGLIQLTRDLAAAVGPWGITANSVSPGTIPHANEEDSSRISSSATADDRPAGLGEKVDRRVLDALAAQTPLGRVGRTEEIAGPVSFLLSPDAAYITGHNLVVDGGWSTW